MDHIALCHTDPATLSPEEAIHNVYELPNIERTIRYLHAASGFPTKSNLIKSIRIGGYLTCPLITETNVHKHFLESEETQKSHMQNQRQGVRSTKVCSSQLTRQQRSEATLRPEGNQSDFLLAVYKPNENIYTYQTGNLPHRLSRGDQYQMILQKN